MKNMARDCEKTEVKVEEILHNITDLVTSKKDTTKKIYQLKSSVQEAGVNPFFYFYTSKCCNLFFHSRGLVGLGLMGSGEREPINFYGRVHKSVNFWGFMFGRFP